MRLLRISIVVRVNLFSRTKKKKKKHKIYWRTTRTGDVKYSTVEFVFVQKQVIFFSSYFIARAKIRYD